jgi:hypothetical protein
MFSLCEGIGTLFYCTLDNFNEEFDLLMLKCLFKSVRTIASVGTESESFRHFHILFHFIDNMILYNLLWLLYLR